MNYSQKDALGKLRKYCAYQDRAHSEVEQKLADMGLYGDEAGEVIIALVRESFLDEERFARSFVRGKFRIKGWGRRKILQELKLKKVSDYCIDQGFKELDEDEYMQRLQDYAENKWASLNKEKNSWVKRKKTSSYLLQKGYEPDLINEVLRELAQV
ncbi:MAG: RecX family transcriptional regulator [Bacteroidetes bacterium]|nr:MAG: RecX family transcriptional regulator [Bacteroidota bacterium]